MDVRDIARGLVLSDARLARRRNLATPAKAGSRRCRQLLVNLISPVAGEQATPLADQLLKRFGSLAGVLGAPRRAQLELLETAPEVAAYLRTARAAMLHSLRQPMLERVDVTSWQGLIDYLAFDLALRPEEQVRILFLDSKNHLILDEIHANGGIDACEIRVREVIVRALELRAAALILVHNHPSGDPRLSTADLEITQRLIKAGATVGISVHDHIVVAAGGYSSARRLGGFAS